MESSEMEGEGMPWDFDGFAARRALELLSDPRSDADSVARLIESAPRLATGVMLAAEYLASRRIHVRSVSHAIVLIGFDRVRPVVRRYLETQGTFELEVVPTMPALPARSRRYGAL